MITRKTNNLQGAQLEIAKGLRSKGFSVSVGNGNWTLNAQLNGEGEQFCGLSILPLYVEDVGPPVVDIYRQIRSTFSLEINNDVVIDSVQMQSLVIDASNPRQYHQFLRPLSGQDNITIKGVGQMTPTRIIYINLFYRELWVNNLM